MPSLNKCTLRGKKKKSCTNKTKRFLSKRSWNLGLNFILALHKPVNNIQIQIDFWPRVNAVFYSSSSVFLGSNLKVTVLLVELKFAWLKFGWKLKIKLKLFYVWLKISKFLIVLSQEDKMEWPFTEVSNFTWLIHSFISFSLHFNGWSFTKNPRSFYKFIHPFKSATRWNIPSILILLAPFIIRLDTTQKCRVKSDFRSKQ